MKGERYWMLWGTGMLAAFLLMGGMWSAMSMTDEEQLGWKPVNEAMSELLQQGQDGEETGGPPKAASPAEVPDGAAQAGSEPAESAAGHSGAPAGGAANPALPPGGEATDGAAAPPGPGQQAGQPATSPQAAQPAPSSQAGQSSAGSPSMAAPVPARADDGKINLNTATAEQLDALPGIGASRAKAILEVRERLGGRFTQVEQLLEVKGIGEKMLEKIRPHVTLE